MADDNNAGGSDRGNAVPDQIAEAARVEADAAQAAEPKPAWVDRWVWQSLWKVVAVGFAVALLLILILRTQHLLRLLGVSFFFALAMIPAVEYMHERWGWKRGAAVGAIYAGGILFVVVMVLVLIPGISEFADEVSENGNEWVDQLNEVAEDTFDVTLVDQPAADDAVSVTDAALSDWADNILGFASSGIGLVFDLATMALFTFYFAADAPRIQRGLLSRMSPQRQQMTGWVWDTAIQQTGGYFYSRMLLMVINGGLFFVAMLLVGMPLVYALPMSIFEGFVSEFIPAVGTYIGAAVPILVTLAVQGLGAALILLVWVLIYQQVENYFLSPKLSAKTMTLNGGVAFGAALAGGAIAGPMGAFMALPIAALITSIISNLGKTYDVVYEGKYESADEEPQPTSPTAKEGKA